MRFLAEAELMFFAFRSSLALRALCCRLSFRLPVVEHCVFALLWFTMTAPGGGPVLYIHVLHGFKAVAESGVLLPLPAVVHDFVAEGVFCFAFPGY